MHIKVALDSGANTTVSGDSWTLDDFGVLTVRKQGSVVFTAARGQWTYVEKID